MAKQKQEADPALTGILDHVKRYADAVLDDPSNGVIGIGLGKKSTGPVTDDAPWCLIAFVERKFSKKELKSQGVTDFKASLATCAGTKTSNLSVSTDVVETGAAFTAQAGLTIPTTQRGALGGPPPSVDLQKPFSAIRAGIGITNPERAYPRSLSVGTLGFFVRDSRRRLYLVSNNHVIADENQGRIGDAIVQPGTLDLTRTELTLLNTLARLRGQFRIARLSAFVPIRFLGPGSSPLNDVDCGIAEIVPSARMSLGEVDRVGFGGVVRGVAPIPRVNPFTGRISGSTRVFKAGRTTGWTEGEITALNVVSNVRYSAGVARFRNQIGIRATGDNDGPFSDRGDSGSAILDERHRLVGLLFAGSPQRTLANPVRSVLTRLSARLGRGRLRPVTG